VIALATLVTAVLQIGLIVYTGRLMRRMTGLVEQIEQELKLLFGLANTIGRDAARVASLAVSQMERADRVFATVATRVEETAAAIQNIIMAPAREGKALLAGLRALIAALRSMRGREPEKDTEDDESLFI
jgi:hypothetical protein